MVFEMGHGTNVSHWLSQSDRRGAERREWFTKADVEFLAGLGFKHVRIPVDEEQLWDESGRPDQEAFGLLDSALDWCDESRLRAVVDLHILRSHHFNVAERPLWTDAACVERFLECWRGLSERLKSRPAEMVSYELLNEPVADDPEDWNRVALAAIRELRALEPERMIVLGSNRWDSVETFDELAVPEDDRLILTFHFYAPFLLTHHRAAWTEIKFYAGPVHYPGRAVEEADMADLTPGEREIIERRNGVFDRAALSAFLAKPLAVAKRTGLPLYCGEWGCVRWAPRADRLRWYADVSSIFAEAGIGWATWDYKGGFGLVQDGRLDEDLAAILTAPR